MVGFGVSSEDAKQPVAVGDQVPGAVLVLGLSQKVLLTSVADKI